LVFLILPVARAGWPRRDEPNSLAAPGINHNQNSAERVHSERNPSFFTPKVRIANCQRKLILKGDYGICETDFMLGEICCRLTRIPLEIHNIHCMHKCTPL